MPSRTGIAHRRQHVLQVNIARAQIVKFSLESNGRFLVFWITSPRRSVSCSRRFETTYHLHAQRFEVRPWTPKEEGGRSLRNVQHNLASNATSYRVRSEPEPLICMYLSTRTGVFVHIMSTKRYFQEAVVSLLWLIHNSCRVVSPATWYSLPRVV